MALSFLGPQGTIPTSEIPQDFSGEAAQTQWSRSSHKMAQKGALQASKGVKQPQITKHSKQTI